MKRLLSIVLLLLLLCGCAVPLPAETTLAPTEAPTEPPKPWVEEVGLPWDTTGALWEIPLTIPDGLHYTMAAAFDGDLLLWDYDSHLADICVMEMCLVELDDGTFVQKDITVSQYLSPQLLGDALFLCDDLSGTVMELNKQLEVVNTWTLEPQEGNWIMGANDTLYMQAWDSPVIVRDLATGEESQLLGGANVTYISPAGNMATVDYYAADTGVQETVLLDLMTGQLLLPPREGSFTSMDCRNGTWLLCSYQDSCTFYVGTEEELLSVNTGDNELRFQDDGTLLQLGAYGSQLTLHDLQGRALASCRLTDNWYGEYCSDLIPSEAFGGYFCLLGDQGTSHRLLYWETTQGERGEDLGFIPVPEADEVQTQLAARAKELSETYGVHILVGTDCGTEFSDFYTEQVTDWEDVNFGLNVLEFALQNYPEGFFWQLRYGDIQRIEIQLVGPLRSSNTESFPGTYAAFAQENSDHSLIVADIYSTDAESYYHEFSHLIDVYLQWDAWQREDALFSDTAWIDLNPGWFTGYSYQYGDEQELQDFTSFIDGYSTVSPTEDRARVMENAMKSHDLFDTGTVLYEKLDYYSACIRDAFDTTGWPEVCLWEQYL